MISLLPVPIDDVASGAAKIGAIWRKNVWDMDV
jgi:hypothetical protein